MRLKAFRVQMYRPILDSGWVNIDDITVIVGKNESGKTALLKALHKFKPFTHDPYTLDREWPRGHRKERSPDAVVVQTRFDFEDEEKDKIGKLLTEQQQPTGVEISKTYEGEYRYKFFPMDLDSIEQVTMDRVLLPYRAPDIDDPVSTELTEVISQILDQVTKLIESHSLSAFTENIETYKSQIDAAVQSDNEQDIEYAKAVIVALDDLSKLVDAAVVRLKIEKMVSEWIPTFIYMDDHKPFQGIAYLDQINQRKNDNQLTDEDETFLMILEMAGLDFDTELQRATEADREQRMLDMNDASLTLTNLLADHWSQREYEVKFEADGYHVIAFVSDEIQSSLVPLNERSKGFQWFFSFDTTFLYETQGTFKNAVILLDEPGLHLHAAAQRDLLVRLKEYAKGNQLIYTTHMPFMIDMERLDNIRVCIENKDKGSTVSEDFYAADEHARFPLQAALGLSISQSLFIGPYNLVVEGITDFWLLSTLATILRSENRTSLDERVVITPSGGATKAAYVATMLQGQELNVVVLLDSDPEGKRVAEGLIKKWIMEDKHVLLLGDVIGRKDETTLEDLFPDEFYLEFVNKAYEKELGNNLLTVEEIKAERQPQIVRRINAAFKNREMGLNSEGWAFTFNKGSVAKQLMIELPQRNVADLPDEMVTHLEKLFQSINNAMPRLKDGPIAGKAT